MINGERCQYVSHDTGLLLLLLRVCVVAFRHNKASSSLRENDNGITVPRLTRTGGESTSRSRFDWVLTWWGQRLFRRCPILQVHRTT
jgi:hypothetical protein